MPIARMDFANRNRQEIACFESRKNGVVEHLTLLPTGSSVDLACPDGLLIKYLYLVKSVVLSRNDYTIFKRINHTCSNGKGIFTRLHIVGVAALEFLPIGAL